MSQTFKLIAQSNKFEGTSEGLGFIISPEDKAVGLTGNTLKIGVIQDEEGTETIIIGYVPSPEEDPNAGFGIAISQDGTVILKGLKLKVFKTEFATHEEAVTALEDGEEYYIAGDNGVYRKG